VVSLSDEDAFVEYYRDRRDVVRRNAYMLCGDWHRADDLAQTALVALHRKWNSIKNPQAVDAYVRTTLVRAMIDESRRPWRRERTEAQPPEPPPSPGSSQDGAERVATRVTLIEALRVLPPRQRAVLVLRYLDGLDVAETARVLGCRQGTVKSQTSHGLAALRMVLGDDGDG
jgi:RNA polymerase sigma-70 factor (sigma-E family)